MEKVVAESERSKVIYNPEQETYTKYFYSETRKKLKFILKLRKYPGENYNYITQIFNNNKIKTAEVVNYTKYSVTTKEIKGKSLTEELCDSSQEKKNELLEKYLMIVIKIINLGIYFGDFHFGNFIVYENELYVIDLEDYRNDFLSRYRKRSVLKRLKRYLFKVDEIYKMHICDGKELFNKILMNIQ